MATDNFIVVQKQERNRPALAKRLVDTSIFLTILLFSAIAAVVLAVTAPVVLAVSAIVGLFSDKTRHRGRWRPAGA